MKTAAAITLLLMALASTSCDRQPAKTTVVLVVRHAEKVDNSADPPLSEPGMERARALIRVAEDAGVAAIFSTQYRRNLDTVRPLADHLGVAITEAPVNIDDPGDYGRDLARQIVEKHPGQTVLVVGHRNTMGAIIEALSGKKVGQIEDRYSDLFIVTVPHGQKAGVIRARYGARG